MTAERFLILAKDILPWEVYVRIKKLVLDSQAARDGFPKEKVLEVLKPVHLRKAQFLRDLAKDFK